MLSDEELREISRRLFVDPHLNVVAAMPSQEFAQVLAQAREANALRQRVSDLIADANAREIEVNALRKTAQDLREKLSDSLDECERLRAESRKHKETQTAQGLCSLWFEHEANLLRAKAALADEQAELYRECEPPFPPQAVVGTLGEIATDWLARYDALEGK